MDVKFDVLETILITFIDQEGNEKTLITTPFDMQLEFAAGIIKFKLDFSYNLDKNKTYMVVVCLTNDPEMEKAYSGGSLSFWCMRISLDNATVISTDPLIFQGFVSYLQKMLVSPVV